MYKVGMWETEITPDIGCGIPGYGELRFGTGVKDKLYVKSAVIEKDGEVFAMVAMDNCTFRFDGVASHKAIVDRIQRTTGIDGRNVLVCSTHTHTGGPTSGAAADGNDPALDGAYVQHVANMAADTVYLAYNARKNVNIKYACGEVKGISFVRNYIMKDGSVKTNPGRLNPNIVRAYSEPDYSLPALFVEDESGKLCGIIYDFSCHQDCVDGTEYSGDYSSIVSKIFKEKYGNDFISVFFCGTAGNINHFNVKTAGDSPDHYVMMGEKIANELESIKDKGEVVDGDIKVEKINYKVNTRLPDEDMLAGFRKIVSEVKVPEGMKIAADSPKEFYDYMMAKRKLDLVAKMPKEFPLTVQVAKIGDVKIFGLQGEIFAQYAEHIRASVEGDKNMFFTLANGDWMYVPWPELYETAIYEADYSSAMISGEDALEMVDKAIEIANKM